MSDPMDELDTKGTAALLVLGKVSGNNQMMMGIWRPSQYKDALFPV